MLGAVLAALVWANIDYGSYQSAWTTKLSITLGSGHLSLDLRHWLDEGLMTFFFLVVGLEAKREMDLGELRDRTQGRVACCCRGRRGHRADPDLPRVQCRRPRGTRLGRGDVDRHRVRAGAARAARAADRDPTARVPADARSRRRSDRADRDRDRVHLARQRGAARGRDRCVRGDLRAAVRAGTGAAPDRDRARVRTVGRAVQVRDRPARLGARGRAGDQRLPTGAVQPRARDRARPIVPRAADARARTLDTAEPRLSDLRQRAAPVHAPSVDQLRDRAAVRTRERRHPDQRTRAVDRGEVADHAGDLLRLRRRQAGRNHARVVARDPSVARPACAR